MSFFKFLLVFTFIFLPQISKSYHPKITVLMYHRFDNEKHLATSISKEKFNQHINFLLKNNIKVKPLNELVEILNEKEKISEDLVFITVDDAYRSFYEIGFPILKKNKIPFSIFISSKFISKNQNSDYMSWEMLKVLSENNGLILNHSKSHRSLLDLSHKELKEDIKQNQISINKKLGIQPKIFSYPYGESNNEIEKIIKNMGYQIAFSQHSAPVAVNENKFRLPRYSLNEEFGDLERFKLILSSYPLKISQLDFNDTTVNTETLDLRFKTEFPSKLINCFINNSAQMLKKNNDKEVLLYIKNLRVDNRYRVNCTYKHTDNKIFWFGKMIKRVN